MHTIIAGDFNCSYGLGFYDEFANFANDNNFVLTDYKRLNDVVTYVHDSGIRSSWIDHVLCSFSLDAMISQLTVLNDVIISDHRLLSIDLTCTVTKIDCSNVTTTCEMPCWNNCDSNILSYSGEYLDNLLQNVDVPYSALYDTDIDKVSIASIIDRFYLELFDCIRNAVNHCIPMRKSAVSDFNVPGWHTYASEKHEAA